MNRTKHSRLEYTGSQHEEKHGHLIDKVENLYVIKNTELKDFDFIHWMYKEAIKYQKRNNYVGWESIDKEYLREEINKRLNYKLVQEDNILCAWGVVFSDPLIWREMENGTSIYLHRVVVNPKFKGRKLFQKVLQWAIQYCIQNDLTSIRIDTWTANPAIIEFYKKYGFKLVEEYTTGDTKDLPAQHRNLEVTLLEYPMEQPQENLTD